MVLLALSTDDFIQAFPLNLFASIPHMMIMEMVIDHHIPSALV